MIEILGLLDDFKNCFLFKNKISDSTTEMSLLYGEKLPYTRFERVDGVCFRWEESFINKCLIAMATDDLVSMSELERRVWDYFVLFQDEMTILNLDQSESLEQYFLDLYNCIEPNQCSTMVYTLEDVSPCLL